MINSLLKIIIISVPLFLSTGCDQEKSEHTEKLKPIQIYSLDISEPSGLALDQNKLWIVSDSKNTIYKTNLKGEVESSYKVNGSDMEGIAIYDDSLITIALETSQKILITDFYGNEISTTSLDIDENNDSGVEGIAYNPVNQHFYIINEKDPVLLIETDKKFIEVNKKKIKEVKDLSDIYYSKKENCLWLLSDEDRKIIKSTLDGNFLKEYEINVEQPEGIAVDDGNNLIYVVSDKEEKLYIFELNVE